MHLDADDFSVTRCLEAYLLWLFGWVMFCNTYGNSVDKELILYALSIAEAQEGLVPQYSWGSAVLAATYRGLSDVCLRTDSGSLIPGCPLFLQLWACERIAIARPVVSLQPYEAGINGDTPEDGPTMGTLWVRRQVCITLV